MGFSYFSTYQIREIMKLTPIKELPQEKPSEGSYKEFESPDGKLKMKYPSDWAETETIDVTQLISQEFLKKYDIRLPLFALKVDQEGQFFQLIVMEMQLTHQGNFEEVINILKEINSPKGWDMEIVKKTGEGREIVFETEYRKLGQSNVYAKEKMLFLELEEKKQKIYIITVSGPERDWQKFSEEAGFIIDSVSSL